MSAAMLFERLGILTVLGIENHDALMLFKPR